MFQIFYCSKFRLLKANETHEKGILMKKYIRLFQFARPYFHLIMIVFILSFLYIFFNTSSYWFSATFLNTIFTEEYQGNLLSQSGQVTAVKDSSINEYLKSITNALILGKDKKDTLFKVCLVIFMSFIFKNVIYYYKGVLMGYIELHVINDIRNKLFKHLVGLPLKYFNDKRSGEITSIMINDVGIINSVISTSFRDMILVPMEIIVQFFLLWAISWKLTVMIVFLIPVFAIIISKIGASIRRKSKRTLSGIAEVVNLLQEVVPNVKIIKAYITEKIETIRFERFNHNYFKLAFRQKKLQNLTTPLNEVIGAGLAAYLLWYGGNQVFSSTGISAEDFVRYLILLFAMLQPLKKLSGLNNTIQTGMAAGERVFEILNEKPEVDSGNKHIDDFNDSIVFKDVTFGYNEKESHILKEINLEIKKGEIVALVGPSGAGKSTLVNLIPRFYDVKKGCIFLDGTDIKEIKLNSLRRLMGIVTQESILFNTTIAENIAYGDNTFSSEEIYEAARIANAVEFILSSTNGFNTIVGERGVKLSGGQIQRLAIARAILKNPPILILDEATSALDTESEKMVQDAIDKLMKNRTVLVIAHRISTVIHADKIVVLNKGRIEDIGPHRKLLKTCSLYRHLYEIQFRDEA